MVMLKEITEMKNLAIPYRSQREREINDSYGTRGCGITALAMVLEFYGYHLDGDELKQLADETNAYQGEIGWTHSGLIKIARRIGLSGYRINYDYTTDEDLVKARQVMVSEGDNEEDLNKFEESFDFARHHSGYEDIERLLSQRIPVIASMTKEYTGLSYSHLVVVSEIDDEKVTVNDPWNNGANFMMSRAEFEKYWTRRVIVVYKTDQAKRDS